MKKTIITISLSLLFTTYIVTTPPTSDRIVPVGFIIDSMSTEDREELKDHVLARSGSMLKSFDNMVKLFKRQGYQFSEIDGTGIFSSQEAFLARIELANKKQGEVSQQTTQKSV